MSTDTPTAVQQPFIRLLDSASATFASELEQRLGATEFSDIRLSHGCVFGNIEPEGSRLTDLAERARMTKQSVGEVTTDLVQRGYAERLPDPNDGRAKIIRLTTRGRIAQETGRRLIDELEREWAQRYGEERVAALRDALEAVAAERLATLPSLSP